MSRLRNILKVHFLVSIKKSWISLRSRRIHFRLLKFWSNNDYYLMKNIGFVNWNLKKTLVVFVLVFGTGRLLLSAIKVFLHQYNSRFPGRNFRKTTVFSMKHFQMVVFSLRSGSPHNKLYFVVFLVRFRKQIRNFMLLFYWRNTTGQLFGYRLEHFDRWKEPSPGTKHENKHHQRPFQVPIDKSYVFHKIIIIIWSKL